MRVIITGGTGTIGKPLSQQLLNDGHEVIVLSRSPDRKARSMPTGVRMEKWDAKTAQGWGHLADGADVIINFAGASIDGRWTDSYKREILSSRVEAGHAVLEAIRSAKQKPKTLVQASAVGYYGADRGDTVLTEKAAPGGDFLAQVCFDWEASTAEAESLGVRRVVSRTGIVLTNEGGAWPKLVLPFRAFAGGPVGSGKQFYPWIHLEDEVRAIEFLIGNGDARGAFNLSAPTPRRNQEIAKTIGKVMGRPSFLPAPAPALKIALGEMSTIVLDGQRAVPTKLESLGFTWKYPTIEEAVRELLDK